MRSRCLPHLLRFDRRDDIGVAVEIVEPEIELLDSEQNSRNTVVRLERQRQDTGQVALRVCQLFIRDEFGAESLQLRLDRSERAIDVLGIDTSPSRP